MTFNEWKAQSAGEIENIVDSFVVHDTEKYFIGEKLNEAYEMINRLCENAFENGRFNTRKAGIDLNKMAEQAYVIAYERGQYKEGDNNTIRALKHCAGEVIEVTEAYASPDKTREDLISELADVIMCVLSLCAYHQFDIEFALKVCLEKNKGRISKG